jgi:hypothetical protein
MEIMVDRLASGEWQGGLIPDDEQSHVLYKPCCLLEELIFMDFTSRGLIP